MPLNSQSESLLLDLALFCFCTDVFLLSPIIVVSFAVWFSISVVVLVIGLQYLCEIFASFVADAGIAR